jgi:hypothetical protein
MRLNALFLVLSIVVLTSCAHGRTQADLAATAFGSFSVDGSERGASFYAPAAWNVEGPNCAHYQTSFGTNDPDAFRAAFLRQGRAIAGARARTTQGTIMSASTGPDEFLPDEWLASVYVDGTETALWIVGRKYRNQQTNEFRGTWSYLAYVIIWDMHAPDGPCSQ